MERVRAKRTTRLKWLAQQVFEVDTDSRAMLPCGLEDPCRLVFTELPDDDHFGCFNNGLAAVPAALEAAQAPILDDSQVRGVHLLD